MVARARKENESFKKYRVNLKKEEIALNIRLGVKQKPNMHILSKIKQMITQYIRSKTNNKKNYDVIASGKRRKVQRMARRRNRA